MNAVFLLRVAAVAHLGLIAAGVLMPGVTGLWRDVNRLPPFPRGLFRTYYAFIGLCLAAFGAGSWFLAEELADGTKLARASCGFLALFWTLRLAAGFWLIDVRPYLVRPSLRLGYGLASAVFTALPFVYGWIALR